MSWAAANIDAERMTAAILERIAALHLEHGEPDAISLAIYPTAHDFRYLRGKDPWSWEHHTAVVRATQRQLKRHRVKITLMTCTAEGCASWCDAQGLVPSTQNRAAYIAHFTS